METTFEYWANRWLEFEKNEVKTTTLIEYKKVKQQLINEFSELKLDDITPKRVQELLDNLYSKGNAKSTINKRKYIIQQIFRYANIQGIDLSNPCSFVRTPRMAIKNCRRSLTQGEIDIVMLHRNNYDNGFYAYCLLMTGLRRSEMLALTWNDLNYQTNLVHVSKTVNYIKSQPAIYNTLKNGDSERYIPMTEGLKQGFKHYPGNHAGLIFGASPETPVNPYAHSWKWEKYKQKTGLDITQHMLRHTYCTMLFDAGVDVKTAAYLMGHRDEHTTLAIYTHLEKQKAAKNATSKLNVFISGPQPNRL